MTSMIQYAAKGRRVYWTLSAYAWYRELVDEDSSAAATIWQSAVATFNLGVATISLGLGGSAIQTGLGWGWTRLVSAAQSGGNALASGWRGIGANLRASGSLTMIRRTILVAGIVHTVTLPWQIQDQQIKAQKEGDTNFNADLKLIHDPMNWQPERYPMNRPNNPMGSRSI